MDKEVNTNSLTPNTASPVNSVTLHTRDAEYAKLPREMALAAVEERIEKYGTKECPIVRDTDQKLQAWYQYLVRLHLQDAHVKQWLRSQSSSQSSVSAHQNDSHHVVREAESVAYGSQNRKDMETTGVTNQYTFDSVLQPTSILPQLTSVPLNPSVHGDLDVSQEPQWDETSISTRTTELSEARVSILPQIVQDQTTKVVNHWILYLERLLQQHQELQQLQRQQPQQQEPLVSSVSVLMVDDTRPCYRIASSSSTKCLPQGVERSSSEVRTNSTSAERLETRSPRRSDPNIISLAEGMLKNSEVLAETDAPQKCASRQQKSETRQTSVKDTANLLDVAAEEIGPPSQKMLTPDAKVAKEVATEDQSVYGAYIHSHQLPISHDRNLFLLRITRITYQCTYRPNPMMESPKNINDRRDANPDGKCTRREPHVLVTFQAQLPSIQSVFQYSFPEPSKRCSTGLQLGFTCSLNNGELLLPDFEGAEVVEKLDSWEQAAHMPGLRWQILSALRATVSLMLERIRKNGISAIDIDVDYVFFPICREFRLHHPRGHQKGASVDMSTLGPEITTHQLDCNARIKVTKSKEVEKGLCIRGQSHWSNVESCTETNRQQSLLCQQNQSDGYRSLEGVSADVRCSRISKSLYNPGVERSHTDGSDFDPTLHHRSTSRNNSVPGRNGQYRNVADSMPRSVNRRAEEIGIPYRRLLTNTRSMSTPSSPTRFVQYSKVRDDYRQKLIRERTETMPKSPGCNIAKLSALKHTVDMPTKSDSTSEERKPSSYLQRVIQEVTKRLQSSPHLPIVVMPWSARTTDNCAPTGRTREVIPVAFQLPQPNVTFVCLNSMEDQFPRVFTAPKKGALIVLTFDMEEITTKDAAIQPRCMRSVTITGPKPGYVLLITSDNEYTYIPIGQAT
ncbi:unnamed protein product [Dicrocoelium dendriticum]|nr:unnamed protein product [Dicrocoelium dendriticum]